MRSVSLVCAFVALLWGMPSGAAAQEPTPEAAAPVIDTSKTPWLEGVSIPNKPLVPSPVVAADIMGPDGNPFPATLTEDLPVLLSATSEIFADKPPAAWNGTDLKDAEWTGKPSVRWFFEDIRKNRSTLASASEELLENQMKVTPLDPTRAGAVTITIARPMKYRTGPDSFRGTFVNASKSLKTVVTDATPPVCGLEIAVGADSGTVYPVENPPHKPTLPKLADLICRGALFGAGGAEESITVGGVELGKRMILPAERAALHLAKNAILTLKPLLGDNQQVDETSVKFGISNGAGDAPAAIGLVNPGEIRLGEIALPEQPFLFIEAADISGNVQILYIPIKIK
ncbi:MAG TPA: hypothetical protein PLP29_02650 [Candidatus Ozemobacteraceae bacterium]|nr:hypothetical protein [Candidatus Ozemobacteraceae bacterium]